MEGKILVCVTVQEGCVRQIRFGHDLALSRGAAMHVLHVSESKNALHTLENTAVLNTLFSLAHEAEAEMSVLYEKDSAAAIARYAAQLGADTLILGPDRTGFTARLRQLLPEGIEVQNLEE